MKKLKRIVAGVLAATIAAGSLTVGASAASAKMKLRTVSIDKIEGASGFDSLGDGYYSVENSADPNLSYDIDQIVYIGKDELESWQKTGKISYKKVKTDVDMTDLLRNGYFTADGEYLQLVTCDKDRNILKGYIVSHNEKNTKLTTAYTKGSDWCYTRPDGYSVEAKWNKAKTAFTVTITAPDGTKKSKKLTYKGEGDAWESMYAVDGTGKYVAYMLWKTNEYTDNIYDSEDTLQYNQSQSFILYGVKKNGKLDTLFNYKGDDRWGRRGAYSFGIDSSGSNFVSFWYQCPPRPTPSMVYLSDSGKMVSFEGVLNKDGVYGSFWGISDKVYGSRAIVQLGIYNSETKSTDTNYYVLADLSTAEGDYGSITALSDTYRYISTEDGKIYRVSTADGKVGYINKKGKELAMFDSAGMFIGDYAPVVKNGKAYLIDRNMKQVSEKIDADWTYTLDEGLYKVGKGDKVMLMTYKK